MATLKLSVMDKLGNVNTITIENVYEYRYHDKHLVVRLENEELTKVIGGKETKELSYMELIYNLDDIIKTKYIW